MQVLSLLVEELRRGAFGWSGRRGLAAEGASVAARRGERVSVVSATPGRLRMLVPGLKNDAELAARLRHSLLEMPGVREVSLSTTTGRALVWFDPQRLGASSERASASAPRLAGSRRVGTARVRVCPAGWHLSQRWRPARRH